MFTFFKTHQNKSLTMKQNLKMGISLVALFLLFDRPARRSIAHKVQRSGPLKRKRALQLRYDLSTAKRVAESKVSLKHSMPTPHTQTHMLQLSYNLCRCLSQFPSKMKASLKGRYETDKSSAAATLALNAGDIKLRASMTDATVVKGPSLNGLVLAVEKPGFFIIDYNVPKKVPITRKLKQRQLVWLLRTGSKMILLYFLITIYLNRLLQECKHFSNYFLCNYGELQGFVATIYVKFNLLYSCLIVNLLQKD